MLVSDVGLELGEMIVDLLLLCTVFSTANTSSRLGSCQTVLSLEAVALCLYYNMVEWFWWD